MHYERLRMSYDLHLVPRSVAADTLAYARSLLERETDEINPGPPVLEKEKRKQQLAAALIRENPQLVPFPFGYAMIAAKYGYTEAVARVRYRHIELNGPDEGNGIQITLYDDTADITVPYWHQPHKAERVFREIWGYLGILEREAGLAVYDPQLDRLVDLAVDFLTVLERYGSVVARMPEIIAESDRSETD